MGEFLWHSFVMAGLIADMLFMLFAYIFVQWV